ncbi:copper amine oxidase N-terminal domain-containing protein [Paenibacillus sp. URB8-2]|uniref:copper amine oxidase N-terminal domain-containing protein n=1 Tax=Paenibacillus sp. URB8-2 TaxID=2741301 RepID=UPI0015BDF80A|nr:copper amine oxidase N-terminal domain-containing protein [Paenibacillus sp. URB8-2]
MAAAKMKDRKSNSKRKWGELDMNKMCLKVLHAVLAALIILAMLPMNGAGAAEKETLLLTLKLGSKQAKANGQVIAIAEPFSENGSVMVPLGVFKKAFGSGVSLGNDDVVKVTYGPHTGAMTIGGTIAWKDGQKVKLTAPPRMVNGVLMVPLRFVAGVIGAKISAGSGGSIVVALSASNSRGDRLPESGIDSEAGKTKVGNSYYKWSMLYPAGLIIGDSGGEEGVSSFISADIGYYLEVHVAPQAAAPDADELLEQLVRSSEDSGEVVLDRGIFPQAAVPYARIISKDPAGALWEGRGYYANGRLYQLYLTDDNAVNYKDFVKYTGLLDSFRPFFDDKDSSIRDLSTVRNGLRSAGSDDYGISLQVPAAWSIDNRHLVYGSKAGSYLKLIISSAPPASTLDSWGEELRLKDAELFVPEAYHEQGVMATEISGAPARVREVRYNYGGGWMTEYQVLLLKNGYRYYAEYAAPAGQEEDKAKFGAVLTSVKIDFDTVKENFGRLEQNDYPSLKNKTVTKTSKIYGYAIDMPRLWTPYQGGFEMQAVDYRFTGGRFQIAVVPEGSLNYTINQLNEFYRNPGSDPQGPFVESVQDTTLAGEPAVEMTVRQNKSGIPSRIRVIAFSREDAVYTLTATLGDANATEAQQAVLDRTLKSFRFTDGGK